MIDNSDKNLFAKQFYWNHTSEWLFYCKFAAYFHDTFLQEHLWKTASGLRQSFLLIYVIFLLSFLTFSIITLNICSQCIFSLLSENIRKPYVFGKGCMMKEWINIQMSWPTVNFWCPFVISRRTIVNLGIHLLVTSYSQLFFKVLFIVFVNNNILVFLMMSIIFLVSNNLFKCEWPFCYHQAWKV